MAAATETGMTAGSKWIPFYRRRWFIIVCLLTISPIALLPLLTGKIYRKQSGDGSWVPVKAASRVIYVILSFWLIAAGVYGAMNQNNSPSETTTAAVQPSRASNTTVSSSGGDTGASSDASTDDSNSNLDTKTLRVEMQATEAVGTSITITSASDSPIAINRVVVNNREATPGCDFSQQMNAQNKAQRAQAGGYAALLSTDFPAGKVLKTGDQVAFLISADCGALVKAEVYTNQGKGSYSFGSD